MKRLLGAATAAVALACAAPASSAIIIFEAIGTQTESHLSFWGGLPGPGVYEFEANISGPPKDYVGWFVDYITHWDYYLAPAPQPSL